MIKIVLTAIVIVTLALIVLAQLFRFTFRYGNWIQGVSVDEEGNPIGDGKPFRFPKPDKIASNGLSHVEAYVSRVIGSRANICYLLIFTPDGQRGLSLSRKDGKISLGVSVEWRREPKREDAVRAFFMKRQIAPTEDYLAGNGNVPDATRILEYPVSGDAHAVAEICRQALLELCSIRESEGLDFTYRER